MSPVPLPIDAYPALGALDPLVRDLVSAQHLRLIQVDSGTPLFSAGEPCRGFPLVLEGEVRVALRSPQGRALELYRVPRGDLCVLSTTCLLGRRTLPAEGTAVGPVRLALLDVEGFETCCDQAPFRRFVFGVLADRLTDLMALVEAVAFQRLDQRLAQALLGHGPVVHTTHQALADELGSVREIVSRLLARFERAGWVRSGRERIEVLDATALRDLGS
ncbi:MAG: Crp/Fnr family transcriptional regulator [Aquincola sp.]|nr:Crp/Fnr family transcriptional regulator [Aquincola sp.]MDH4289271.1 Crp/Fnr family transcriptional regulator [Aquincola sp.]MDH5330923.1 Crp/Fnr family transcriptional regulator [Aquincola sp.]